MSEARPFSRIGDWGTHFLEQAGAVAEAFFQQSRQNLEKTEEEGPPVKPVLPPLSLYDWTSLMDPEGRISDKNYEEVMRYAFYGVCCFFGTSLFFLKLEKRVITFILALDHRLCVCVRLRLCRDFLRIFVRKLGSSCLASIRATQQVWNVEFLCETKCLIHYFFSLVPDVGHQLMCIACVCVFSADYQALKHQWKTMLPEQLKRCTKFRERVVQISLLPFILPFSH